MIKYDLTNINKWYNGSSNIVKCYHGSTIAFDLTGGGAPVPPTPTGQTPCYAVTNDIAQYQATDFVDVYDTTADKWYKLNNLNEYEEYGIYGSGRTNTTYYEGKLTIDNGYEYIYSGNTWVNLGAVSGTSIIIKSPEYIEKPSTSIDGGVPLLEKFTSDTKIVMKYRNTKSGGGCIIADYNTNDKNDWRIFFAGSTFYYDFNTERINTSKSGSMSSPEEWEVGNYYVKNFATGTKIVSGATQTFDERPNQMYYFYSVGNYDLTPSQTDRGQIYYTKIYRGDTLVRDFIPWTDMNGNYGLYDKVEGVTVNCIGTMTGSSTVNDVEVGGGSTYPEYYDEIADPPTSVTFATMADALAYQCPYVGLRATIAGDNYIFNSNYEWEEVTSRLPVGYTEVEYIQNTGTSYLDIAFVPNQDTRVIMEYQLVTDSGSGRFWGAGAWNSATGIEPNYEGGYLQISWLGKSSWTKFNNFPLDYNKHVLDLNKNYLYLDETLVGSNTYTTRTASDNLGVFTYIGSGRPSSSKYWGIEHFLGKMFSFKVYDNGTLIRDLIPCKRDNDNEVGAYDIVNDVFYTVPTGYTTDKLIAGNPV